MKNPVNKQIADQSSKGVVLGVVVSLLASTSLDASVQGAIITLASAVLAFLSTKMGDKGIASFFDR